jgi:site-specific DNA-methyltransferase (adenine-specific)
MTAPLVPIDRIVVQLATARQLLAAVRTANEAKGVFDVARAVEDYARRQKLSQDIIADATAVKVEAMARMGELLESGPKNPGARGNPGGRGAKIVPSQNGRAHPPKLADLGIGYRESSDAQTIARAKRERPELFDRVRAGKAKVGQVRAELTRADRRAEVLRRADAAPPVGGDQNVIHSDCRPVLAGLPAGSVDLILTDPPYDRESTYLFHALAALAPRVLVPGGVLATFYGQYQTDEVRGLLNRHLRPWWTVAVVHTGTTARVLCGFKVLWKPLALFTNGPRPDLPTPVDDLVISEPSKVHHEWEQGLPEALYCVEHFCPPGGLVFDPCCGSGTNLVAAKRLQRRWLGCDNDPAAVATARRRLAGVTEP